MRNHRRRLNNSGVALVTVLVITAVTLALGYAALTISLSVLQGSKAAESSVQARLNAESGLDAVFVSLEQNLHLINTEGDVHTILADPLSIKNKNEVNLEFNLTRSDNIGGGHFHFTVEGQKTLGQARYITESSVFFPFLSSEIGDGSTTSPSFPIDDAAIIAGSSVDVGSGQSEVTGNIYSNGSVFIGNKVNGSVASLKSCSTSSGTPGVQLKAPKASVGGNIYSACDMDLGNVSSISGTVSAAGQIINKPPSVSVDNSIMPDFTELNDSIHIGNFVNSIGLMNHNTTSSLNLGGNSSLTVSNNGSNVSVAPSSYISNQNSFSGNLPPVVWTSSLSIGGNAELTIRGNVIIYSAGNVTLSGKIIFEEDSSLTIISPGKVELGNNISTTQGNQSGFIMAYTSTNQEIKINNGKDHDIYAGIYSPNASIKIQGGGNLNGVVYGNTVDLVGQGSLSYAEPPILDLGLPPTSTIPKDLEVSRR